MKSRWQSGKVARWQSTLPLCRSATLRLFFASLCLLVFIAACASEPEIEVVATAVSSATAVPPTIAPSPTTADGDNYAELRQQMVQTGVIAWGITDEAVVGAMGIVPRHQFVPTDVLEMAYENHPLPIGYGQTISQPYIVALMTQEAQVESGDTVLEIGTGSGYQAAVLAQLVDHVYTIEIIGALAERAQNDLERAGYDNVTVRHADGYFGWEEQAPFDAIVVTAAPDHIPQPLVQQLKIGGHLIIPVGPVGGFQTLWRVTRTSEDEVQTKNLGGVRFVPFTREER